MSGAISHVKSSPIADMTGTVTVFNSLGITETIAASRLVLPSDWNSAHQQLMTLSGNTAGASTLIGTNLVLQGGPNVTLSGTDQTIIISAPTPVAQSVQTQNMVTVQGSTGAIVFGDSNGISFGGNASTITASHNGLTSQSGQAVSAANGSSAFQTLSMVDTNGVSWATQAAGLGATVRTDYASSNHSHGNPTLALTNLTGTTASNSAGLTLSLSAAAPAAGVAFSAGTESRSTGTVVFSNSNGVSFGMNTNGVVTATVNPGAAAGIAAIQGGTQTATSGTVVFSDSNGISFGMSGSTRITASYTVPSTAGLVSAINVSGGTTSNNLSAITFSNSNGISFGLNAGTMTASHNGITSQTVQTQSNVQGISAGTQVGRTGDIVFSDSNGISFGMSGSSRVTASYTVPSTAGLISAVNLSAGTTSQNLSAFVFSNSNNVSFGLNGSTVTASATVAQSVQTQNVVVPTAGTQTATSGTVAFANSNGITFGMSGSSQITASHNGLTSQTVQTQSNVQGISAGTQVGRTGDIVFSDSNGISFGMSGSSRVTASYTVPSTAGLLSAINVSAGTTSNNLAALTFSNSNGITFGLNASTVTASHNGITSQTVQTQNVVVPSAGTQTATSGTVVFSNSNGITFGMSNSSVITASYTVPTVPAQLSVGMSTAGNTSGDTGFVTGRLALVGGANVTLSGSTNGASMTISISGGSAAASPVNFSAGTTSGNLGSVVFSNSNGVSFGLNGSTITASAAAGGGGVNIAASNTTFTSGTVVMSNNGGALTISSGAQSVLFSVPQTSSLVGASGVLVSTNGSTISIYREAESFFANQDYLVNSQSQTFNQSTSVVFPFFIKQVLRADFMRMFHSVSLASTSFGSTANTQYSYNQQETYNIVMYSRGVGASSLSLQSVASTSVSVRMSVNLSRNATNNISVTHGLTYPVSNGTSSISFSYAATNSSDQFSTTHMTALTSIKAWDTNFGVSAAPGRYWIAMGVSTTQTTQGTANLSAARLLHSLVAMSQPNNTLAFFGSASNSSVAWQQAMGSYTTNGVTTASINMSAVSSSASHNVPYFQMMKMS